MHLFWLRPLFVLSKFNARKFPRQFCGAPEFPNHSSAAAAAALPSHLPKLARSLRLIIRRTELSTEICVGNLCGGGMQRISQFNFLYPFFMLLVVVSTRSHRSNRTLSSLNAVDYFETFVRPCRSARLINCNWRTFCCDS